MNKAKMPAFHVLQPFCKTHLILYLSKITWNPIPQGRAWAFFPRMVMVKIQKSFKRGLHTKRLGIEVPGGARLHLSRKGANPSYIGISTSDLSLESYRLVSILLL